MINWRNVDIDGLPTDGGSPGFLVSDGKYIEFSFFNVSYKCDGTWNKERGDFNRVPNGGTWVGGSVYAVYEEVSGTEFDFDVRFWAPVSELNLPTT